jgi:hypothetical protein
LDEVAAAVNLKLAAFLCLEPRNLLGNVALEQDGAVPALTLSSVLDATNFGRVFRAVAFSSAGSVDLDHDSAKIS